MKNEKWSDEEKDSRLPLTFPVTFHFFSHPFAFLIFHFAFFRMLA